MAALTEIPKKRNCNIGILEMDVLQHLLDWGQLTAKEIAEDLQLDLKPVAIALGNLLFYGKVSKRSVYEGGFWCATDSGRRFFPENRPTLAEPKAKKDTSRHPEQVPTVNTICLPDPADYLITVARWIKLTDLPGESGRCHTTTTGGRTIESAPEPTIKAKRERRPPRKSGPPPQDPLKDQRLPEVLRLRNELHYNVKQIARALHMDNDYLKRMLIAAGVPMRQQRSWRKQAESAAD